MSTPASIGIKAPTSIKVAKPATTGLPPSRSLSNGTLHQMTCVHRHGSTATYHVVTSYSSAPRDLAQSHDTTATSKYRHGPDEDRTARLIKSYVACRSAGWYNSGRGLHRTNHLIETTVSSTPNDKHVISKYINGSTAYP